MSSETNELPPSIELAWGLRTSPAKGPRRGLTLRQIVDAAVAVADAGGLDAVSMSRVATELGVATMSLYRYVSAKQELLMLMVDAAAGAPPDASETPPSWRTGLARWAGDYLAALRRHPWAVHVPISGPPTTPNAVAWMERALWHLRAAGLSPGEQMSTLLLLSGYVRNHALLETQLAAAVAGADVDELMIGYGKRLSRLTTREDFPALHDVIASGVLDEPDDDPDEDFTFGLRRVLDGVEAYVERLP
jgi:AcrR family transcriptional regulator